MIISYLVPPGVLSVRLLATSEGGKDVTIDQTSFELSKHMLGDAVCVFYYAREVTGRCSDLEVISVFPALVVRFSFLTVKWIRRVSIPGKIKLRVTDLSGSDLWKEGWPLPAHFWYMDSESKCPGCKMLQDQFIEGQDAFRLSSSHVPCRSHRNSNPIIFRLLANNALCDVVSLTFRCFTVRSSQRGYRIKPGGL